VCERLGQRRLPGRQQPDHVGRRAVCASGIGAGGLAEYGEPIDLAAQADGWIAASLGAVTAAYTWALLSSVGTIPLALAILIFYLFPLVATVILASFGWETLSWKTIAAIVVAFIGLVLALDPRVGNVNVKGVLLGFAAAVGLGIVVAVSSRVFCTGDSRPVAFYIATIAAILLVAFCMHQGEFALPNTTRGWAGFAATAFFYAFAMIAFFIAVSMIGPARSSLLCYAEPVVSAALGVALLGETLMLTQVSGIVLMVGAGGDHAEAAADASLGLRTAAGCIAREGGHRPAIRLASATLQSPAEEHRTLSPGPAAFQ